eukprot:TRINITY_DN42655_c0_g1_i1.p2 TRINITY_DN42655_c0_g1~~TRINITY_DN42655_c0_g1_i1.p2  ORF type:complete len:219 (-),score=23.97 TRINITY_DN42655_c0_g1_i1:130-786(-)
MYQSDYEQSQSPLSNAIKCQRERQKSNQDFSYDKFKTHMPFHPTLNNNLTGLFNQTKMSQLAKINILETSSFKTKPRGPIYNSNIDNPCTGSYDITTQAIFPKITRNIFMPYSSYDSLKIAPADSLDFVNILEVYKKQQRNEKIQNDFSKQVERNFSALLFNESPFKSVKKQAKVMNMNQEDLKKELDYQQNWDNLSIKNIKVFDFLLLFLFAFLFRN